MSTRTRRKLLCGISVSKDEVRQPGRFSGEGKKEKREGKRWKELVQSKTGIAFERTFFGGGGVGGKDVQGRLNGVGTLSKTEGRRKGLGIEGGNLERQEKRMVEGEP